MLILDALKKLRTVIDDIKHRIQILKQKINTLLKYYDGYPTGALMVVDPPDGGAL